MTDVAKRVLIIGATSDIARGIARAFAARGHTMLLAGRDGKARLADDVADLKLRYRAKAEAFDFDLEQTENYDDFLARTAPEIVICNAGFLGDQVHARQDASLAHKIMMTNYVWCSLFLGVAANRLESEGKGAIIGISSVAGDRGRASNYIYGSAKAGFTAFMSGLRNRLAPRGIGVLTVKPGFVATRMTEGMKLPATLTALPDKLGEAIYAAWRAKRDIIYYLGRWQLIMLIIIHLPEFIFKKTRL